MNDLAEVDSLLQLNCIPYNNDFADGVFSRALGRRSTHQCKDGFKLFPHNLQIRYVCKIVPLLKVFPVAHMMQPFRTGYSRKLKNQMLLSCGTNLIEESVGAERNSLRQIRSI